MKAIRKISSILIVFLFVLNIFSGTCLLASAEQLVGSVSVTLPETVKIGERLDGITPSVTAEGLMYQLGPRQVEFVVDDISAHTYGGFIRESNSVNVEFWLYPVNTDPGMGPEGIDYSGNLLMMLDMMNEVEIAVNGTSQRGMIESCHTSAEYRMGIHVSCQVNVAITGRTLYSVSVDTDGLPMGCNLSLPYESMPEQAEAGVELPAPNLSFWDDNAVYEVDYYTLNGAELDISQPFTMPAEDAVFGAVLTNKYKDAEIIRDVNINIKPTHEDVIDGERLPTEEEFLGYITEISTSSDVDIKVKDIEVVAYSEKEEYTLVMNSFITVWLEVPDGYAFMDYSYTENEEGYDEWFKNHFALTVNGCEDKIGYAYASEYSGGTIYCDGIFVKPSYYSINELEIQFAFSYGYSEIKSMDLSQYEAGETVTIPKDAWNYEGYYVIGYRLSGDGTIYIEGNTFEMPEGEGWRVEAEFLRCKSPVKQKLDSVDKIQLEVEEGTFDEEVMLSIDLVDDPDDWYFENENDESSYEVMERVEEAVGSESDTYDIYELSATYLRQYLQPQKTIVATFEIPEGFDRDKLVLYYVDADGNKEEVEIRVEGNKVYARINHFSTYVLASKKPAENFDAPKYEAQTADRTQRFIATNIYKDTVPQGYVVMIEYWITREGEDEPLYGVTYATKAYESVVLDDITVDIGTLKPGETEGYVTGVLFKNVQSTDIIDVMFSLTVAE